MHLSQDVLVERVSDSELVVRVIGQRPERRGA